MAPRLMTLVLTPSLGGDYFGDLLVGIARETIGTAGRLVVMETLTATAPRDEAGTPGEFSARVAWSHIDGVIAVTTAVGAEYLELFSAAGKPVVLLSNTQSEDFSAPVARPENRGGTATAVEHLIQHGHSRIGFVGNLGQRDICERLAAYQETLERHGLVADPAHVFEAPENGESGGVEAAMGVLAAAQRPTALMVATDRNAIGVMRALANAGVGVPADLAIVSFDNIAAGTFTTPTLSTVNQSFDEVGALAARLLLAKMRGKTVADATHTSSAGSLIVRESCGCDTSGDQSMVVPAGTMVGASTESLRDGLQRALQNALRRELTGSKRRIDNRSHDAIVATVLDAVSLIELGDRATSVQISALVSSLQRLTSNPETLRRFADAMTDYAHRARANSAHTSKGTLLVSARVAAALWKLQAGAFLQQAEAARIATEEQFAVDAGLLDTIGSDPRNLEWLGGTHVKAGALGLWRDSRASNQLEIVGTFDPAGEVLDLIGDVVPTEEFPPIKLIASASSAGHEVCVVVPVSNSEREWGLLAIVVEISPSTSAETYQHWAALLCTSLESQRLQETVRRSALFDPLTGLPNRQLLVTHLDHAIAQWQRSQTPFAVLFLDLDGFKLINDSLGHSVGDRVLEAVGAGIMSHLRTVDTAARFGGDEFVILLADTDPQGALAAAIRVQDTLSEPQDFDGHLVAVRATIGIATSAIGYASAEDVLRDADIAMYRARTAEPGTVAVFDAPMHESAVLRASLDKEVKLGLKSNQFEMHYQPIVDLVTGRTERFEALIRWRHPERGLLLPEAFLPVTEATGLIVELGQWALDEVCRQLAEWGPAVVNVSINISDSEFWSQDLLSRVLATLMAHGLTPDRLTLEVTERVLMRRPDAALKVMQQMHSAGLILHIDDFGTGNSSLETLHRFPVEAFKIDRSFIRTLTTAENSAELIEALVQLGNALNVAVMAEGVETAEQLRFLQRVGCATGQGHLFMPAVTGARAAELIGTSLHATLPAADL